MRRIAIAQIKLIIDYVDGNLDRDMAAALLQATIVISQEFEAIRDRRAAAAGWGRA
jgi:hypothetical protein